MDEKFLEKLDELIQELSCMNGNLESISENLEALAGKLSEMADQKNSRDAMLLLILSECDYYTESEVNRFKQILASYRKLRPAEYLKAVADALFRKKQYGKAVARYQKILELPEDETGDDEFCSRVYHNLGAAYAQMFQFHKALAAYEKSYELREEKDVLKRIYFLSRFAPELEIKKIYRSQTGGEERKLWDQEADQAALDGEQAEEVRALRNLFKKDPVKRMNGAVSLVNRWKKEYRKMV